MIFVGHYDSTQRLLEHAEETVYILFGEVKINLPWPLYSCSGYNKPVPGRCVAPLIRAWRKPFSNNFFPCTPMGMMLKLSTADMLVVTGEGSMVSPDPTSKLETLSRISLDHMAKVLLDL